MSYRAIAPLFAIVLLGISSGTHHHVHVKSAAAASIAADNPARARPDPEARPKAWRTTDLVETDHVCLPLISHQAGIILRYVPTANMPILPGPARPAGSVRIKCEASVSPLTWNQFVARWQYLWVLLIYAVTTVLILAVLIGFRAFRIGQLRAVPVSGRFWLRPFHASAAWTFKDSWATNIAAAGTAAAGILTAAGAIGSMVPGVQFDMVPAIQFDRYAMLIAACGVMIIAGPLAFAVFKAMLRGCHLTVPDDTSITLRRGVHGPGRCTINVPAGADIMFPGGAEREVNGQRERVLAAGASVSVPVDSAITVEGERIALASEASVIAVAAGSTITVSNDMGGPAGAPGADGAGPGTAGRGVAAAGQAPIIAQAGAAVTVAGAADIELLRDTEFTAPHRARTKLREEALLKVPVRDNAIAADLRSVIPAAAVTMFGIGAELGIAGVLGGSISAKIFSARAIAVAVGAVLALVTLWYAAVSTRTLPSPAAGSALSAEGTSYTL